MASLVTLAIYKDAINETSAVNDAAHQFALDAASQQIRDFTDRDFGSASVTESRTYLYDGTGVLEIDDATAITALNGIGAHTFLAFGEGPAGAAGIITWLLLPEGRSESPLMGFTRNADVFLSSALPYSEVTITGTWGWPIVPANVQQATIWAAISYEDDPSNLGGLLAAKSVAEVHENYTQINSRSAHETDELPRRVRAMLLPYRRVIIQ